PGTRRPRARLWHGSERKASITCSGPAHRVGLTSQRSARRPHRPERVGELRVGEGLIRRRSGPWTPARLSPWCWSQPPSVARAGRTWTPSAAPAPRFVPSSGCPDLPFPHPIGEAGLSPSDPSRPTGGVWLKPGGESVHLDTA